MSKDKQNTKPKDKFKTEQVENHETAAWANKESTQPVTNVRIPNQTDVRNAKEWVDTNEK